MSSFEGSYGLPGDEDIQETARTAFYAGVAAGATALVVEDDYGSRLALTTLLERGSLTVIAAPSGPVALDTLAERDDIGIVLMDIMMPVMDGYEGIATIRQRPQHADLPIIAVTGKGNGRERERCLEAGASDFVPKPIDSAALLAAIARLTSPAETRKREDAVALRQLRTWTPRT
jgi:CheY-like chemotaxis protein